MKAAVNVALCQTEYASMPVVMHRRPQFTLLHLENLPIELRLQLLAPSHLYYLSLNLVLKVSRYLQLLKSSSLRSPPAADMPRRADNPHPRYASNTPEAVGQPAPRAARRHAAS